ncbi:MAG: low molecular weight phosphatase family protein [Thermoplasmata archaeon]|nr:low molecular weight phosphatase family protein [Thermoplasmata archaeon]TFG70295.1 MAG: low molecular weight phosphatase family protein [Methanomassiliicoccus sp.]
MCSVYFVCHGNTCRSPMAAEIFRQIAKANGADGVSIGSFGTEPCYPDNPNMKESREAAVTEIMGGLIELYRHRPKGIEGVDLKSEDLLVILNPGDMPALKEQIAETETMPRLIVWDIEDPFLEPLEKYIDSARAIKSAIERDLHLLLGD